MVPHQFDGHSRCDPGSLWTGGRGVTAALCAHADGPDKEVPALEPGYLLCIARFLAVQERAGDRRGGRPSLRCSPRDRGPRPCSVGHRERRGSECSIPGSGRRRRASFALPKRNSACYRFDRRLRVDGARSGPLRMSIGSPASGEFLDTIVEDRTGIYFDATAPEDVEIAIKQQSSNRGISCRTFLRFFVPSKSSTGGRRGVFSRLNAPQTFYLRLSASE